MNHIISFIIIGYYSCKFIKINSDIQLLRIKKYIEDNSDIKDGDSRFF